MSNSVMPSIACITRAAFCGSGSAKSRVIWRAADAVSPPLYPAGLSELIADG